MRAKSEVMPKMSLRYCFLMALNFMSSHGEDAAQCRIVTFVTCDEGRERLRHPVKTVSTGRDTE